MSFPQVLLIPAIVKKRINRYFAFRQSIRKSLDWHHNKYDKVELKRTKLPKSEKIELHCVWATEAFSPSNIDSLLKSLSKLGWDRPETNSRQNLNEWIKQGRSLGKRSSWNNAGIILRRGDNRFFGTNKKYCKLPSFVDYAKLSLRNITPSLTLVTIQFILRDEEALSFNNILASDEYKTYVKYYPNRLHAKHAAYIDVVTQKREATKKQFDKVHSELFKWVSNNLPGYYSNLGRFDFMPMVDMVTDLKYIQQDEKEKRLRDHYTDMLFGYSVETWKSAKNPELELRLGRDTERPSAVLFGNFKDLTKNPGYYGGKGRALLVNMIDDHSKKTIDLLATHNVLISLEQQLSQIRDKASSRIKSMRKALTDVNYIRNKYLSISRDSQSIGRDLGESGIVEYIYDKSETADFKSPYYYPSKHPNLIESLRKEDESRAKELLALESHVKEAVLSNGNIASAIANLRIQRYVFWLTIITAVFTLISISPTLIRWGASILEWFRNT